MADALSLAPSPAAASTSCAGNETFETLLFDRTHDGQVIWITLNRPKRINAMSFEMIRDLQDAIDAVAADKVCRVLILKGAGRGFCSGADLRAAQGDGGEPWDTLAVANQRLFSTIMTKIHRLRQPAIAAIHGVVAGGGMSLALSCDVVIAAEDMRMHAAYIKVGLSGCEMGISYNLPKYVSRTVYREMLMTGNEIDAERALAVGAVSHVVPCDELVERATAMAEDMLKASVMGLIFTKEQLNMAECGPSMEAVTEQEDIKQVFCLRDEECQAVGMRHIMSLMNKSKARARGGRTSKL